MSADDINTLLDRMRNDLRTLIHTQNLKDPLMIGIHTGGVWVAERLHAALDLKEPLGVLNIAFYRDDFTRLGINPQVQPSKLPVPVDNRNLILVDDVLYTGRTVRAALNELFDYGRPAKVVLAVLFDRGGRELPIGADVVGKTMILSAHEQIKLTGPDPLSYQIQKLDAT